jgi:hypothetical protein
MPKNRLYIPLAIFMASVSLAFSGDFSKESLGTTGGQFLELPVGARNLAMGAVQNPSSPDAFTLFYNPAGIVGLPESNLGIMYAIYFQDVSYQNIALTREITDESVLGLGIQHLRYGSMEEMDNIGNATGSSLSPSDMAVSLAYARSSEFVDIGFAAKYISSRIQAKASTSALDVGLQKKWNKFSLGLSWSNLGKGLKYGEETSNLPTTVRLSSGLKIENLSFGLDGLFPKGAQVNWGGGIEYSIKSSFALRAGYNTRAGRGKLGSLSGLSGGCGLKRGRFSIDYSLSSYGDLGNAHRFSVLLSFGR